MQSESAFPRIIAACLVLLSISCQRERSNSVTVPMTLDHNRMLIDAEIQRSDGTWRPARLWVDSGNPEFLCSEDLAKDIGVDLSAAVGTPDAAPRPLEIPALQGVRIGGKSLDFSGVRSRVLFQARWLFGTMHIDGTVPSTVLMRYQVVFDYPRRTVTIADKGGLRPRGVRAPAAVDPETGIVQIDAVVAGESLSFALDNGASFSFIPDELIKRFGEKHPDWPQMIGAVGCANIWGWWPQEGGWPVMRLPEILWGPVRLTDVAVGGLPRMWPNGDDLATWYSLKTARPVNGFLGPNAFKSFRVEIDYPNSAVYFEKGEEADSHDLDIVGLTVRLLPDGVYQVIGVVEHEGRVLVDGVLPEDLLLRVGQVETKGATMGTVIDALRGKPGETRHLLLERDGKQFEIGAKVERFL